jgi:hypothetical protein
MTAKRTPADVIFAAITPKVSRTEVRDFLVRHASEPAAVTGERVETFAEALEQYIASPDEEA